MLSALRRVFRRHEHGKYGNGTQEWCRILRKITNKAAHSSYRRKRPAHSLTSNSPYKQNDNDSHSIENYGVDEFGRCLKMRKDATQQMTNGIATAPTTAIAHRFTRFISGGIVQSTNGKCIFAPAPPRSATRTVPLLPGQHYVPLEALRVKK
jgi:hypothetical protein